MRSKASESPAKRPRKAAVKAKGVAKKQLDDEDEYSQASESDYDDDEEDLPVGRKKSAVKVVKEPVTKINPRKQFITRLNHDLLFTIADLLSDDLGVAAASRTLLGLSATCTTFYKAFEKYWPRHIKLKYDLEPKTRHPRAWLTSRMKTECSGCGSKNAKVHALFECPVCPKCKKSNDEFKLISKTAATAEFFIPERVFVGVLPSCKKTTGAYGFYGAYNAYARRDVEKLAEEFHKAKGTSLQGIRDKKEEKKRARQEALKEAERKRRERRDALQAEIQRRGLATIVSIGYGSAPSFISSGWVAGKTSPTVQDAVDALLELHILREHTRHRHFEHLALQQQPHKYYLEQAAQDAAKTQALRELNAYEQAGNFPAGLPTCACGHKKAQHLLGASTT